MPRFAKSDVRVNGLLVDAARMTDPDFDPYGLMPRTFPDHPRVMLDGNRLHFWRERVASGWPKRMLDRLLDHARNEHLDDMPDERLRVSTIIPLRRALAGALTGDASFRDRALADFRRIAAAHFRWVRDAEAWPTASASLGTFKAYVYAARAYDLLAADGLDPADDDLFRETMRVMLVLLDRSPHLHCGNHNTWSLAARLALGVALGDRQVVHDSLYGCDRQGTNGEWRCGLVHQIRHDILADGHQWERSLGYHFYTLMAWTDAACLLRFAGGDLWNAELPALLEAEGKYMHRGYGPAGSTRSLRDAFDMPFYYMFANGDCAMPGDSGVAHIRGVTVWGAFLEFAAEIAVEMWDDDKLLWLLGRLREEHADREAPEIPPSLETTHGDIDFVRLDRTVWADGEFSLADDARIGATGRHESGCTLLPMTGVTVLRRSPERPDGTGAFLFWGPHSAGHQNPAALHLDIHLAGRRISVSPVSKGYDDPMHERWHVRTVASNTVTLDETSMFPQEDSAAIFEADRYREHVSDGELLLFAPGADFHATRAANANVYPGARLERTVVATDRYVLDIMRVDAEQERQTDWTLHLLGATDRPADAIDVDLGAAKGYAEFDAPWRIPETAGAARIVLASDSGRTRGDLRVPSGGMVVVARDPHIETTKLQGVDLSDIPRTAVMARTRARSAVFVSIWTDDESDVSLVDATDAFLFDESEGYRAVVVHVREGKKTVRWTSRGGETPIVREAG